MTERFADDVVVVTGAGAYTDRALGIGEATATRFAAEGASVVVADADGEMAERTADAVREAGGEAAAAETDVADREAAGDLAATVRERFGSLDVLVNNAAVRMPVGPIPETNGETYERLLDVNLRGPVNCIEATLPLLADGGGSVVNVASVHATVGRRGWWGYDSAKAGLVAVTRDAAADHYEDGVRVNAVAPGWTITDYHLQDADDPEAEIAAETDPHEGGPGIMRRAAHPREQAAVVAFLASEDASFVTGTTVPVDGGTAALGTDLF